jgi:nickel transport protein
MIRGLCYYSLALVFLMTSLAEAHSIHYQVENKGISVRIFYSPEEPASYSAYEIFGPEDKIPHKKGRTDKNGFVSFLPDRAGKWLIRASGESDHGHHGVQVEVIVNESLFMESFKKPLMARYNMFIVGVGFIFGIFGLWALLKARRKKLSEHK